MTVSTAGSGSFTTGVLPNSGATTITVNFLRNGCVSRITANNTASVTVNPIPVGPVITKNPNVATVCDGSTLSITVTTPGTGGAGTSQDEYRFSTDNGTTWSSWSTTLPSFTAVAGTNSVESRRTSTGSGCTTAAGNTVSWIVSTVNTWTGAAGTTAWTTPGNWSCGLVPTAVTDVIIGTATFYPVITSPVAINSLTINTGASLNVVSGNSLTVTDVIINNGTFALENNSNLLQVNNVANTGAITVKRNTSSEVKRLDYNLWSSPVAGQNLLAFSPETLTNRFYVYNPTNNLYSAVPPATTDFAAGTGYLIRMPNTFSVDTPGIWEGTFTGVPNNGTYTITVGNDTFNAIGNPYPSTVDLDAFLAANPTTGTVYFWRKTNNALNSSYATYVPGTGAANLGGGSTIVPNGTLQVGQGFIVKSTGTAFNFTNAMRVADHGNQFLRTAGENAITTEPASQKSRLWLNLNSNVGIAGQIVVGYVPNATQGIDAGIDGRYINDSPNAFTSIINGEEFIIQGRSLPFTAADVVPLGFKTTVAGAYTIALNQVDGLFTDETLPIIIKDNVTGTEHNLRTGAYEFTAVSGVFNGRFELKYQSTLSVTNPIAEASTLIYRQEQALQVKVSNETLTAVTVYDLTGRVIAELSNLSTNEASLSLGRLSSQVLLVRVQTQSGDLVRKVLW